MLLVGRGDVVVCHSSNRQDPPGKRAEARCSQAEIQHQERPLEMPLSPSAPSGLRLSLWDPLLLRFLFQEGPAFVTSHFCSSLKCPTLTTSRLAPLSTARCLVP